MNSRSTAKRDGDPAGPAKSEADAGSNQTERAVCARRHFRFGWWSLLSFLSVGMVLESLHGFKVGWYLDVSNETRRLLWTLGHAHGTLIGMLQIAFAVTVNAAWGGTSRSMKLASNCLVAAGIVLPGGFLVAGVVVYDGDPGPAILLVPLGALLLFVGVLLTAWRRQATP